MLTNLVKKSPVIEQQSVERRQGAVRIYRFLILAVVNLVIFLIAQDVSIVTIALPTIQRELLSHLIYQGKRL